MKKMATPETRIAADIVDLLATVFHGSEFSLVRCQAVSAPQGQRFPRSWRWSERSWLAAGGDERIRLSSANKVNQYGIDPSISYDLASRGSCTVNALSPLGHQVAQRFSSTMAQLTFNQLLSRHEEGLRIAVDPLEQNRFDICWAPSGTDLMYYPLLFARLIGGHQRVRSIISCPEELGAGSLLAAQGRGHVKWSQLGRVSSKHGGSYLSPPEIITLPARNSVGHVRHRSDKIKALLREKNSAITICHLVFGSKSGIEDDISILADDDFGNVMWVVDLCQYRVGPHVIPLLLKHGALVALTGSKYFGSPPFCAAMLVPERWSTEIQKSQYTEQIQGLASVIACDDLPASWRPLRRHLQSRTNWSLRLRWEIALQEMRAYSNIDPVKIAECIDSWRLGVCETIDFTPNLRLMADGVPTCQSIVSFQALKDGAPLSHTQNLDLYQHLLRHRHGGFPRHSKKRILIGRPVRYEGGSFLRLALDSQTVRALVAGISDEHDLPILQAISRTVDGVDI